MIVLNKPAGLPSQGGSGQGDRHVDGLAEALKFGYKEKPKLVHRLDKDTSGVLMLARTDRVARALSESLRHRNARKIYWAVVAGVPHPRQGLIARNTVCSPVGRPVPLPSACQSIPSAPKRYGWRWNTISTNCAPMNPATPATRRARRICASGLRGRALSLGRCWWFDRRQGALQTH